MAKFKMVGMQEDAYVVQILNESGGENGVDFPSIRVIRGMDMEGAVASPLGTVVCDNPAPPLDQIDPNDTHDPKRSLPVWLRIEVDNVGNPLQVQVTGKVGWGSCPTGIDSCDNSCTVTATDPDLGLLQDTGKWGFIGHHREYFVDLFRAGSEPGP